MILLDFNALVIDACSGSLTKMREINPTLTRHIFFKRLSKIMAKNKKKYGLPVVCLEGGDYWRRDVFPQYKASRTEGRKSSGFDWEAIYGMGDLISEELGRVFSFPVVKERKIEADDTIASIVRTFPEKHIIISRDGDFLQLKYFGNVSQYDFVTDKMKELPDNQTLDELYVTMIIKGQAKDGIPNMFSSDDRIVSKIRQKPISKKMVEACVNSYEDGFDIDKMIHMIRHADAFVNALKTTGITDDELRHNLQRNYKTSSLLLPLPDFDEKLKQDILNHEYKVDPDEIMNYFQENKLIEVSGNVNDFILDYGLESEETEQDRWNNLLG